MLLTFFTLLTFKIINHEGNFALGNTFATAVYKREKNNTSLNDHVISFTALAVNKALQGEYEEALEILYTKKDGQCGKYGYNSKSERTWLEKVLTVLFQCAIYR